MKKLVKYSIILMFCSAGIAYGQTQPVSVEIGGKDHYRHGYNSIGGGETLQNPGWEERDSVTVSSEMRYFVLPSEIANPGYSWSTPMTLTNVISTFTWSFGETTPRGAVIAGSGEPLITVKWNTLGAETLSVLEVPDETVAACSDGTPTTIPVVVIPKPTIAFAPNAQTPLYADEACELIQAGAFPVTINMNVSTESTQVEVSYTVTRNGEAYSTLNGTDIRVVNSGITITFPDYGLYEITLTDVSDRVSRKSSVEGDIVTLGKIFTFNLTRPIQTGPIYRLPNNF